MQHRVDGAGAGGCGGRDVQQRDERVDVERGDDRCGGASARMRSLTFITRIDRHRTNIEMSCDLVDSFKIA